MKVLGAVFLAGIFLIGCGGSNNRQLLSLTVNPASATAQNGQMQFTATGQFSSAPMTVTPTMVAWAQTGPGFDPPGPIISFTVADQPFTAQCFFSGVKMNVTAFAPMNANAGNGTMPLQVYLDLTLRQKATQEGGFVAGSAQLTCP
jgi:hypothetical protein